MTNAEITTENITVPNGDLQIAAYLAQPAAEGKFPAVIVIQEIFGVNAHIREVTERIAKEGYVAIAPAIYQRLAPGFETGYTPEDIKIGREYKAQTTASELISDIQATIDYLKTQPQVQSQGFGCIGFCFGGHVAYLATTLPEIAATASFYGAGIATQTPGGGPPTVTRTADIKGALYGFFGTQDASIPLAEVDRIAAELQKHDIKHQVFRYNADHGFFCDHRGSYDATAAAESWEQVKQLFKQELQLT
ncbi:MAG: dienelactone hydrolase family protein [Microcoleus sp. SM1_3_4]|nr:dienelactone hydrolase family protein [Microcoleus sp. SM1_3_4]